ncbi:tudor domain-containing 6 [Pempheris klunzingeri]|uniref:tudor domain-containing 6 n=1 Tax=Pempheris klunzingeri TaxID=3127111 RepID=UPI003980E075
MCSIPGLPTPGTELHVLITRVNLNPTCGLVELWVKMDDDKKHIYEQMREDIQTPKRKFYGSEGKPGDLCLVYITDTWHRARIVSIESEIYNIFLIDQGQPHITTSDALAWGQSDSFLLPPETESCILANVFSTENNWPERATKFLKSLPGKKFQGLVHHVLMPDRTILLGIPVVSKHLYKFGVAKKIPIEEFKCLVQKCLPLPKGEVSEAYSITKEQNLNVSCQLERHHQYFYPELLTDTYEIVQVTEVINPLSIFCKLLIFSKALKILSEQIQQHYEESADLGEAQPQTCGDPCAAKGINGRWHRSLLKQNMTTQGAVEVFHVDEGKTELIPVEYIKPMHGKFLKMPVVTYTCSLDGVEDDGTGWTTDQTDYLKSLLLNHTAIARLEHHNIPEDVYYVTLYADNAACINDHFKEKAGLSPPSKTEQDSNVQSEPIASSLLSSLGDKWCVDLQNNLSVDGLLEETSPSTKNTTVSGRTDDIPTSGADDIHIKEGSGRPDPLIKNSGHLSTDFTSEAPNAHDYVFTVGSTFNVKVSCIESLQKFWCQTTENDDHLRLLMQELQNCNTSSFPQPLAESICVARNPDNNMWYRAKIFASHHSPVVDVRFIDYGQTQKVPLRDVRPIDPAFLRLNAQAFQCCLFDLKNPTNPTGISGTDAALAEFQNFVDLAASSNIGMKCIIKAVKSDEEGLLLNVVDIETSSNSACKLLAQKCVQAEACVQIPPAVTSDTYNYSTHNVEVGGIEKVWVTSSEDVNHFYCQLDRNSHLFDEVMENVKQLASQPQNSDHPLGLNSICFARYTDNQWYRGQVVEVSPKLAVHFVDYGVTLAVNESDICPFPNEASIARSVPVQAVPLGLFDVPAEVPQEVNDWFADHAISHSLTISVVAKRAKGKLIVELFDGSLNVNAKVREGIQKLTEQQMTGLVQQTDQQLCNRSGCLMQELVNASVSTEVTEANKIHSNDGMCAGDELNMSLPSITDASVPEIEHGKTLDEERKLTPDVVVKDKETELPETFIQGDHRDLEITQLSFPSCSVENVKICMYKKPNISQNNTVEVYTSCIVGPHFFWCQYSNTEDLNMVSRLAQEVGQVQQEMVMIPNTLDPGSPCLALFPCDNQWYRAQVIQRTDHKVHVLFVDYGNESEVDLRDVKPLPQNLLEKAPQAFLCSLNGFDESKGSWDDEVYEDFYNLLVDKPLGVTVFKMEDHSEIAVPQYAVKIEYDNVVVNSVMQKYWKPFPIEHSKSETNQTETSLQGIQTESNMTHLCVSKENVTTHMYKKPNISKDKKEEVYASSISAPNFFWCQYANSERLDEVSRLAQEAGQLQQDMMFPETLGPGSPCLALFSSDNQWYRAQVNQRVDDTLLVVFVDYGNESEVHIKNVRSLPQSMLEKAPEAFLCSLHGFDESTGSWNDEVYDDFYNLVVDKPLKLTVFNMEDQSDTVVPQYAVEIECEGVVVNTAMRKYWKPIAKKRVSIEGPQAETSLQDGQTASNTMHLNVSGGNVNICTYRDPNISRNETEMVYSSCIVDPHFFWCQYANTEELDKVSRLAQEAGQVQQDMMFPETLGPGSPCLALFSSDEQWYRAQVIRRVDDEFNVLFVDYGNESNVNIKNVRPLPLSLLEKAPQAFLCSLNGFVKSKGSWDDKVCEDFYNLIVDKPLRMMVFSMDDHSEAGVPQYAVEIECEGVVVNTLMEKYWSNWT